MLDYALEQLIAEEESLDPIGDEFEQHSQYLHRCRRVRVGPTVVVVFENTRTLWLRLRELARFARLTNSGHVRREMSWYDSLLPGPGRLLASVSVPGAGRVIARTLDRGMIELRAGDHRVRGVLRADAAGDRVVGLVRWVQFNIGDADKDALADDGRPLTLYVEAGAYAHETDPLGPAVRASLLADLSPTGNLPPPSRGLFVSRR
jgi:hypothetical protein